MTGQEKQWDVFISHASEDKEAFVRPLVEALSTFGVSIWYDEFSLSIGDSLSRSIDKGLRGSKYGLVIISPCFLKKPWTEYELRGLVSREISEDKVILPVWHGVTHEQVLSFSPPLADKVALKTEGLTSEDIAIKLLRQIRPDLYSEHSREELKHIVSGESLQNLQKAMDETLEKLEEVQEELSEYKCSFCNASLASRVHGPVDDSGNDWDVREEYECGHQTFGGYTERPCPSDPNFPKFEDFELCIEYNPDESHWKYRCYTIGKTSMAQRLYLSTGYGTTREEAEGQVKEYYHRCAKRR